VDFKSFKFLEPKPLLKLPSSTMSKKSIKNIQTKLSTYFESNFNQIITHSWTFWFTTFLFSKPEIRKWSEEWNRRNFVDVSPTEQKQGTKQIKLTIW